MGLLWKLKVWCVYLTHCSECLVKADAHCRSFDFPTRAMGSRWRFWAEERPWQTFPQGQWGAIEGSGQRKDLGRLSHKGSGEPLKILDRGKTWADFPTGAVRSHQRFWAEKRPGQMWFSKYHSVTWWLGDLFLPNLRHFVSQSINQFFYPYWILTVCICYIRWWKNKKHYFLKQTFCF